MDPRLARQETKTSRPDVALLLAKGKLVGCLTTSQSKRSNLDPSDINKFHDTLHAAILQVTPSRNAHTSKEFKKCVAWIVCHTAKSRRRVAALGEYLVKLAESFNETHDQLDKRVSAPYSAFSRARINLLHLLDAAVIRIRENPGNLLRKPLETYITFAKAVEPTVVRLVELATTNLGRSTICSHQALSRLLAHWEQERLFTNRIRLDIRKVAREAYINWLEWLRRASPADYDKMIITIPTGDLYAELPITHGSPEDAWYDLPVGAMVHGMRSTKPGHPLRTSQLKPLDMPRGAADPDMMVAVLEHIDECKNITSVPNVSSNEDQEEFILNGVGLRVSRNDKDPRSFKLKEGYYGFSVPFMRLFDKIDKNPPDGPERPANWLPPPPPQYTPQHFGGPPPPPFTPQNLPPPPPMRDAPYQNHGNNGGGYPSRGNGGGWRGGEGRGGPGNWRGPPRGRGGGGGGGGNRGWGNAYRPY